MANKTIKDIDDLESIAAGKVILYAAIKPFLDDYRSLLVAQEKDVENEAQQ